WSGAGASHLLARGNGDVVAEPDLLCYLGQRLGAHQTGVTSGQRAFRLFGKAPPQPLGDDEAEDAVTEEFEPLVAAPRAAAGARAWMSERLGQQLRMFEIVPEHLGERRQRGGRICHVSGSP